VRKNFLQTFTDFSQKVAQPDYLKSFCEVSTNFLCKSKEKGPKMGYYNAKKILLRRARHSFKQRITVFFFGFLL